MLLYTIFNIIVRLTYMKVQMMLKFVLCSLLLPVSFAFSHNEKVAPQDLMSKETDEKTRYILGLLNESKTIWRDSDDWKETIKKDGATAITKFSPYDSGDIQLNARFVVENKNGTMQIFSSIRFQDRFADEDLESEVGSITKCQRAERNNEWFGAIIRYNCRTVLPREVFEKHIQKIKKLGN
jgi:hypothetical protein